MNKLEYIILKKRNIWFHIIIGYLSCGIWAIIYFYTKYKYNERIKFIKIQEENNRKKELELIEKNKPKLISELYFTVAGVTFENRQEILKNIVKNRKKFYNINLYYGMTNREIIEGGENVYEVNDTNLHSVRLEPTKYKNKDAIEIYIKDEADSEELMIGYCPKYKIKDALEFLKMCHENPNYRIEGEAIVTGGKVKTVDYDIEKDKQVVVIDEHNYGVLVGFKVYDK